jgi:pilus assembly protein Flp/PilA
MFEARDRMAQLVRRQEGQSAVEYGVILALVLAVSVVVITTLGTRIHTAFKSVCDQLPGGACP